jgi:hypothetical protein
MTNVIKRGFLGNVWHGDYSLAKTFWFGLIANVVIRNIGLFIQDTLINPTIPEGLTFDLAVLAPLYLIFTILWLISVWRSSRKYLGRRIWVIGSRVGSLLFGAVYTVGFFVGAYQTINLF